MSDPKYSIHRTFAANVDHAKEREAFEQWYVENVFDLKRYPIGSEQCACEWKAWLGRAALAADKAEDVMTRFSRINQEMDNAAEPVAWVGLTDEERLAFPLATGPVNAIINYAKAIEAALKAKNAAQALRELSDEELDAAIDRSGWPQNMISDFVRDKLREVARVSIAAAREVK